jgi:hypothetical protein
MASDKCAHLREANLARIYGAYVPFGGFYYGYLMTMKVFENNIFYG